MTRIASGLETLRRQTPRAVWAVWALTFAFALWFVWSYGPRFPYADDITLTPQVTGSSPITLRWLWGGYHGHRFGLAWLILAPLHRLTGGDHRIAMLVSTSCLAAASAMLLVALHRVRGRASLFDIAIPLAWMHLGHWQNLLLSFQLWVVLSAALVGLWIAIFATSRDSLTHRRAPWAGCILIALPFLAASGAVATPPLAAAAILICATRLARPDGQPRTASVVLAVSALAALTVFFAYTSGLETEFSGQVSNDMRARVLTMTRFLGLALGPYAWQEWSLASAATSILTLATLLLLLRCAWREPEERVRILALLGAFGVAASLTVALAWSRASNDGRAGSGLRYLTLALPLFSVIFFSWEIYAKGPVKYVVLGALTLASCLATVRGSRDGVRAGVDLRARARSVEAGVASGQSSVDLAVAHYKWMHPNAKDLARAFAALRRSGMPPFDGVETDIHVDDNMVGPFLEFGHQPFAGVPSNRIHATTVAGREVAAMGTVGEITWHVPAGARRLTARFGMLPEAARARRSDGVLLVVEFRSLSQDARLLFEQAVTPVLGARAQPEYALSVELPTGLAGDVALINRNAPGRTDRWDRVYWADVAFQ